MITLTQQQLIRFPKQELVDMVLQLQNQLSGNKTMVKAEETQVKVKETKALTTEQKADEVAKDFGMDLDLLPENKTHHLRMEIRSESSNKLYVVSRRKTSGQYECSCPAWIYSSPRKPCKHIKAMAPVLQEMEQKLLK